MDLMCQNICFQYNIYDSFNARAITCVFYNVTCYWGELLPNETEGYQPSEPTTN